MNFESLTAARSFLFVPGDRPDRFEKALASGADHIIIDLEDAVSLPQKAIARENVKAWLASGRPAVIRLNTVGSEQGSIDLKELAGHSPTAFMLAKTESVSQCHEVNRAFLNTPIIPIIETALGLLRSAELAAQANVVRLAFGSLDFQLDLGIPADGEALAFFRSQLILNSRLAGVASPIDGVTSDLSDGTILQMETDRARAFGFGAKLCVHPVQIALVNTIFSPSEAELRWARLVVDAEGELSTGLGATLVNGEMVDRPVLLKAQRILRQVR